MLDMRHYYNTEPTKIFYRSSFTASIFFKYDDHPHSRPYQYLSGDNYAVSTIQSTTMQLLPDIYQIILNDILTIKPLSIGLHDNLNVVSVIHINQNSGAHILTRVYDNSTMINGTIIKHEHYDREEALRLLRQSL